MNKSVEIAFEAIEQKTVTWFVFASCALIMAAHSISASRYLPISKIEEGTVVERNDSIITVVIPDVR